MGHVQDHTASQCLAETQNPSFRVLGLYVDKYIYVYILSRLGSLDYVQVH